MEIVQFNGDSQTLSKQEEYRFLSIHGRYDNIE